MLEPISDEIRSRSAKICRSAWFAIVSLTLILGASSLAAQPSFQTSNPLEVGSPDGGTQASCFFDANGDGELDLATGVWRGQNQVFLNDGSGSFTLGTTNFGLSDGRTWVLIAFDVDGDADLDLFSVDERDQSRWYLNDGAGSFTAGTRNVGVSGASTRAACLVDVDGDADMDLVLGIYGDRDEVWLNDGAGNFSFASYIGIVGGLTRDIQCGDMDGDGDDDLVIAAYNRQNQILLNDGAGGFATSFNFGTGQDRTWALHLVDLNGDGALDVVCANYSEQDRLYLNLNDASGNVSSAVIDIGTSSSRSTGIVSADFDADFDTDLAICYYGETDRVWLNTGGTFTTSVTIDTGSDNARSIRTADMDADGDSDIFIGNYSGSGQDYLYYNGDRQGLTGSIEITVATNPMRETIAYDYTVRILDTGMNVVTNYTGAVDISSTLDGAIITLNFTPADMGEMTLVGGLTLTTVGTHTLQATDGSLTGQLMNVVVEALPTITAISYDQLRGSMQILIDGTGFDATTPANNLVDFEGLQGTVISASAVQILVEVPSEMGLIAGDISVEVNGATSNTMPYTLAPICVSLDSAMAYVVGSLAATEIAVSGDGQYIAFISESPFIVAGDTNNLPDVFLYNIPTTGVLRLNVGPGSVEANGTSDSVSINQNGTVVAFRSLASNLGVDGGAARFDTFVWDSSLGASPIELISVSSTSVAGNRNSLSTTSISDDGNRVVFISDSTNLDPSDINGNSDVFLRDRVAGTTTAVSRATSGVQPNQDAYNCVISGDGNHIAWRSFATNVVPGVANGVGHIYVRHLAGNGPNILINTTVCASVNSGGSAATSHSTSPSLSDDGSLVAFATFANLVGSDTSVALQDIYVRDLANQTTERAVLDLALGNPSSHQFDPRISGNGSFIVYYSSANDLVASDLNQRLDVFRTDRSVPATPVNARISVSSASAPGDLDSTLCDLSDDGTRVGFISAAGTLVASDSNRQNDCFYRNVPGGTTTLVTRNFATGIAPTDGSTGAEYADVSSDGRYTVFVSNSLDLSGGTAAYRNVFRYDRDTTTLLQITAAFGGGEIDGDCIWPRISDDGDVIAFQSSATNLIAGDTNGYDDIFAYTVSTTTMERLSVSSAGVQGNINSFQPEISGDGTLVVFHSSSNTLHANDTNVFFDVYLRNLTTDVTDLISADSGGMATGTHSYLANISNNGEFVVFSSLASNLVGGDTNGVFDIYRYEIASGNTIRVSLSSSSGQPSTNCKYPSVSNDGNFVAFHSDTSALASGDSNDNFDVFLRNVSAGTMVAVSRRNGGGAIGNGPSFYPDVSPDGAFVVFRSAASNLSSNFSGGGNQIYLYDIAADVTKRISTNSDGVRNDGDGASLPKISADGRWVVYHTEGANLDAGDENLVADVYLAPVGE